MPAESAAAPAAVPPKADAARATSRVVLKRFDADIAPYEAEHGPEEGLRRFLAEHEPAEVVEREGNLLMLAGADFLIDQAITGGTTGVFNATNSYIGVGDSTTAAANSQTDLQAATNKLRKQVSGAPSHTDGTNSVSWSAAFGTSEANFHWQEWALFNASTGGVMWMRKVEDLGTKTSGTWTLTITWSVA